MAKEVFFLKDSEINEWLINAFAKRNYPITFLGINNSPKTLEDSRIKRILKLHFGYIKLAIKSLMKSKNDDVLICLLDVLGLYLFIISKLLFQKRKIIIINVMYNDANDLITQIKRVLFSIMLKDECIYPTVTSLKLSDYYKDIFNIPSKSFHLLHDCYGKLGNYKKSYSSGMNYVFCGGTNGRDWESLLKITKLLPDIKFVIVGPKADTLGENYPSNIEYYYNISFDKFQELVEKSTLLALPLKTQAPAGLIVLFSGGLMSKPVITSNNDTMKEYITSGENGILVDIGDSENFAKQIGALMSNNLLQNEFGEKLYNRIETLGSPDIFIETIINIIDIIKQRKIV